MLFYIPDAKINPCQHIMQNDPKSIQALIYSNTTLAKLTQRSQQQSRLESTVRSCLSSSQNMHLSACSLDNKQLTLHVQNSSQATALRLASQNLLQKLHQDHNLDEINSIRIRINKLDSPTFTPPASSSRLPQGTATLISELAETITDPALKKILRRLSTRHKD